LNALERVDKVARHCSIKAESKVSVVCQREFEGIETEVNLPKQISRAIAKVRKRSVIEGHAITY
jgi:hypothetical protein